MRDIHVPCQSHSSRPYFCRTLKNFPFFYYQQFRNEQPWIDDGICKRYKRLLKLELLAKGHVHFLFVDSSWLPFRRAVDTCKFLPLVQESQSPLLSSILGIRCPLLFCQCDKGKMALHLCIRLGSPIPDLSIFFLSWEFSFHLLCLWSYFFLSFSNELERGHYL